MNLLFLACLFVIELIFYGLSSIRKSETKKVKSRLMTIQYDRPADQSIDILKRRRLSEIGWLDAFLGAMPGVARLEVLMRQSNVRATVGLILLLTVAMFAVGYLIGSAFIKNPLISLCIGASLGYLPILFLRIRKSKRSEKFQRQLPDALELVARTLRAGHAFSGGMKMVCEEFDDPIGTEFQRTLDEINYGVSVPEALKNLASRVDCADLKYFVVSVVIQRDTGGNLAEIVDTMGHIIRERFKLLGKIRVLSAEGRYSAFLLCLLPFVMAGVIFLMNPKLIMTLHDDPAGRILATIAIALMILGILVIRKMIRIRV